MIWNRRGSAESPRDQLIRHQPERSRILSDREHGARLSTEIEHGGDLAVATGGPQLVARLGQLVPQRQGQQVDVEHRVTVQEPNVSDQVRRAEAIERKNARPMIQRHAARASFVRGTSDGAYHGTFARGNCRIGFSRRRRRVAPLAPIERARPHGSMLAPLLNERVAVSESEIIDILLLLALPASGKSEVRRYLANLTPAQCRDDFHLGPTVQLDDYPYVHMMRRDQPGAAPPRP